MFALETIDTLTRQVGVPVRALSKFKGWCKFEMFFVMIDQSWQSLTKKSQLSKYFQPLIL